MAAVNAIKAAEPVPELKGTTTIIKVVSIIECLKSISKHQIIKGTALGEVVLKMNKLFDWHGLPKRSSTKLGSWLVRTKAGLRIKIQICWKSLVKEGISGDLWGASWAWLLRPPHLSHHVANLGRDPQIALTDL